MQWLELNVCDISDATVSLNSLIIFESEAASFFGPNLSSNPCKIAKSDEMKTFSS